MLSVIYINTADYALLITLFWYGIAGWFCSLLIVRHWIFLVKFLTKIWQYASLVKYFLESWI